MTFLDRILHPRGHEAPSPTGPPGPITQAPAAPGGVAVAEPHVVAEPPVAAGHREAENHGTRHDTFDKASAYWIARLGDPHKDPFVLSTFDAEADARAALLELPCIHEAADTGNLICSEVLIFGYYPAAPGTFEAIICGRDLSHELWEQARDAFARHGGRRKNDLEPEESAAPVPTPAQPASSAAVVFEREEKVEEAGTTFTYRIHRAPDAGSAKAFLEEHPVSEPRVYLQVNTPEGTYCRDIDGMYRQ